MPTIYLIRHTKPDVPKGLCYGQTDVPLAVSFPEEAAAVERKLTALLGNDVREIPTLSSPLQRCTVLAKHLSRVSEIQTDERLKEMNFGAWEMQAWGAIDEFVMNAWMRDFVRVAPPLGETFEDVALRAVVALKDAVAKLPEDASHLVLVCHAGVVRALLAFALELPLHRAFALEIDYGSVSAIRWEQHYSSVLFVNR